MVHKSPARSWVRPSTKQKCRALIQKSLRISRQQQQSISKMQGLSEYMKQLWWWSGEQREGRAPHIFPLLPATVIEGAEHYGVQTPGGAGQPQQQSAAAMGARGGFPQDDARADPFPEVCKRMWLLKRGRLNLLHPSPHPQLPISIPNSWNHLPSFHLRTSLPHPKCCSCCSLFLLYWTN